VSARDRISHDALVRSADRLVVVAGLLWVGNDHLLVQRRAATKRHGANMLEFPGGKVELGEHPHAALSRELIEELGASAASMSVASVADVLHHVYPPPGPEVLLVFYHVLCHTFTVETWQRSLTTEQGTSAHLYHVEALPIDQFLAADRMLVTALRERRLERPTDEP